MLIKFYFKIFIKLKFSRIIACVALVMMLSRIGNDVVTIKLTKPTVTSRWSLQWKYQTVKVLLS